MVVVELTYKKQFEEVEKYLASHKMFLKKQYEKKVFLFSGPKNPRDGGIIIAKTDKKTMQKIIEQDPFYQHGIADYKLIEFTNKPPIELGF